GAPTALESFLGPAVTFDDHWRTLERDLQLGQTDRAEKSLAALLAHPDLTPENILALREKYGSGLLLRLGRDPKLAAPAAKLIATANEAARAKSLDPVRIRRYIGNLGKSAGERAFAIEELRRAGEPAVPYFLEALATGTTPENAVVAGLLAMNRDCWKPAAAMLDSGDERLIGIGVEMLRSYQVVESAERLWFVAANPAHSSGLRELAQTTLVELTGIPTRALPSAPTVLAQLSEAYYQHRGRLARRPGATTLWQWTATGLSAVELPAEAAEEFYAMLYAKQALTLRPGDDAAKVLLASIALQGAYDRVGLGSPLPNGAAETALAIGPDLAAVVLTKALKEHKTASALGAMAALGATSPSAADDAGPALLGRAINYPSRRVQFAAAVALLDLNQQKRTPGALRVVQTLIQALGENNRKTALVVDGLIS
ncbi:MAG: hypothetical protein ACRDD1_12595, partial [Planctomycetia bacterium]